MDEQQIIRYIKGLCTPAESEAVETWILASSENADIFFETERIWLMKHEATLIRSGRPEKAYRRLVGLLRPEPRKHLLLNIRSYWKYVAIILIAVLVTVDVFYDRGPHVSEAINMIEVPNGQRVNLVLSDGTKVNLNSNSCLRYPAIFSKERRNVELEGEAFFEVAPDKSCPFVIQASEMRIKVLGTSFNVKAYRDEIAYVTLESGKVEIRIADEQEVLTLNPHEQASYSRQAGLRLHQVSGNAFYAWRNGELAYVDNSLSEIAKDLERRFNVHIIIRGQELAERKFSLRTEKDATLRQVLTLLKGTRQLDFSMEGSQVVIYQKQ